MKPLVPFPTHLEIQTTTYCGAKCSFCPHHHLRKANPAGTMDELLFRKIIDECAEHSVKQISPYFNGEPLTDKRIFRFIDYIALRCPTTHIELSTTGQLLNRANAQKLLDAPLGELRISSMGVREQDYRRLMPGIGFDQAIRNIEVFLEAYHRSSVPPYKVYIVTLDGLLDEEAAEINRRYWKNRGGSILTWQATSRAGNVPHWENTPQNKWIGGCRSARNTHWMSILHDGAITLCCMDWRHEVFLGDAKATSLLEIWEGKKFSEVRDMSMGLVSSPREFLCKRCEWAINQTAEPEPQI